MLGNEAHHVANNLGENLAQGTAGAAPTGGEAAPFQAWRSPKPVGSAFSGGGRPPSW